MGLVNLLDIATPNSWILIQTGNNLMKKKMSHLKMKSTTLLTNLLLTRPMKLQVSQDKKDLKYVQELVIKKELR